MRLDRKMRRIRRPRKSTRPRARNPIHRNKRKIKHQRRRSILLTRSVPTPTPSPFNSFTYYSDIKKKLIDSQAGTPTANSNLNLDNKGQGRLGGGCCS